MDGSCTNGLEMLTSGVFLHWVTVENGHKTKIRLVWSV